MLTLPFPITVWPTRPLAMAKRDDRDREAPGSEGPPRYDAPGWVKGTIAVVASCVWAFTVVESVQRGTPVDPYVHVVFVAVLGAVFGIDVRRWNK